MIHRVKVQDHVHQKLRDLKAKMGLSFNEIIDIGISVLLDYPVKGMYIGSDIARVTVNLKRVQVPLDLINQVMKDGRDIFIPDIGSRKASYLARKLRKQLGLRVLALSSSLGSESGYVFMFIKPPNSSLVQDAGKEE